MPALTLNQLTNILGTYVESGGDFKASLNQVLARMFGMGTYRDLTVEYSLPVINGAVTLPEDAGAVLLSTVDGFSAPVRSLWHDYKNIGRGMGADMAWGLIDSGYVPTLRNMPAAARALFVVPSEYQDGEPAFSGEADGSSICVTATDGNKVHQEYAGTNKRVMVITGTLTDTTTATIATPVFLYYAGTYNGKSMWSADGSLAATENFLRWETALPFDKWTLNLADGLYSASSTTDSATPEGLAFSPSIGNGTPTVSTYSDILFDIEIDRIINIRFDGLISTFDIRTDPDDVDTTIARVGPDSGVTRYRAFRLNRSTDDVTTVHVLCKREFIPLRDDDDLVHIGNIGAIKHGLLGRIAEDSADLERATYHWQQCLLLLEEEAAASRGAAIPTLNFDPCGLGGQARMVQNY